MLLCAMLVFLFSWDLVISRQAGLILILSSVIYLILNCIKALRTRKLKPAVSTQESATMSPTMSLGKAVLMFLIGAVLVVVGSRLLVNAGIAIATALKIPSLIIGLTAVAIGTSLPELVTAIKSSRKKVADLAIGNIIGANILNLGLITGVSAMIRPLTIDLFTRYYAFAWMFIMIIGMMMIFWKKGKMSKRDGIIMLSLYIIYILGLVVSSILYPTPS